MPAREGVEVKLLAESGEVYIYAQSRDRVHKERAMRRRQMRWLRDRLQELTRMKPKRDDLLMKLGAARQQAPAAWRLFDIAVADVPRRRKKKKNTKQPPPKFSFALRWDKLREARRQEGRYLLRSNTPERPAPQLWQFYLQLGQRSKVSGKPSTA